MTNLHRISQLQEVQVRDDVILHPLAERHSDRFFKILDEDPAIRDRVQFAADMTNEEDFMQAIADNLHDDEMLRYAIERKNRFIGLVSFWRLGDFRGTSNPTTYGFGYFLDRAERGNGIVTDVVKALMQVAMKNLEVERFIAFCEDDNEASQNVLKKAGFVATDNIVHFENTGWTERRYERIVSAS